MGRSAGMQGFAWQGEEWFHCSGGSPTTCPPFYFSTDHVILSICLFRMFRLEGEKKISRPLFTILLGPFKTSLVILTVLHASCNLETALNGRMGPSLNVELCGFSILDSSKKDWYCSTCVPLPRPRPPISLSLQSKSVMVKPCCRPLSETPCSLCTGQFLWLEHRFCLARYPVHTGLFTPVCWKNCSLPESLRLLFPPGLGAAAVFFHFHFYVNDKQFYPFNLV